MKKQLPDYMSNFNSRYFEHKGQTIHFIDQGSGVPIVLLHGNPTWSLLYHKMIPILSKKYRVIVPDLLGFGLSTKPKEVGFYTIKNHLSYLTSLLESLKLKKAVFVGQDWGGPLIATYAISHPSTVKSLVLMNTYIPGMEKKIPIYFSLLFRSFYSYFLIAKLDLFRKLAFMFGFYSKLPKEIKDMYFYPGKKESHRIALVAFPKLIPTKESDEVYSYLRKIDSILRVWKIPKLLIFSDHDIAFNYRKARILYKRLPNATFRLVKDAGHYLQEDKGEEVSEIILSFLKKLPNK